MKGDDEVRWKSDGDDDIVLKKVMVVDGSDWFSLEGERERCKWKEEGMRVIYFVSIVCR